MINPVFLQGFFVYMQKSCIDKTPAINRIKNSSGQNRLRAKLKKNDRINDKGMASIIIASIEVPELNVTTASTPKTNKSNRL